MQPRYLTACVALPALLDALQAFYLGKVCRPVDLHMKGNLEVPDCQEVSHYQFNCSENKIQCRETQTGFWLLRWRRVDPSCLQRHCWAPSLRAPTGHTLCKRWPGPRPDGLLPRSSSVLVAQLVTRKWHEQVRVQKLANWLKERLK